MHGVSSYIFQKFLSWVRERISSVGKFHVIYQGYRISRAGIPTHVQGFFSTLTFTSMYKLGAPNKQPTAQRNKPSPFFFGGKRTSQSGIGPLLSGRPISQRRSTSLLLSHANTVSLHQMYELDLRPTDLIDMEEIW